MAHWNIDKETITHDNCVYEITECDLSSLGNMGKWIEKESKIVIDSSMSPDMKQRTLFHECTHLALVSIGEYDLNNQEGFVERLANVFYRMCKDNKDILLGEV